MVMYICVYIYIEYVDIYCITGVVHIIIIVIVVF